MEPNAIALARTGNTEALATLIKQALQVEDMVVNTSLQDGCLQILLESPHLPNEQVAVNLIRQELQLLNSDCINTVNISAQLPNNDIPVWTQAVTLKQVPPHTPPHTTSEPFQAAKDKFRSFDSSEFLKTLRTFRFSAVVPYREALNPALYSHSTVKLLLFFGLFPLAVSLIGIAVSLKQTAWILGLYYAAIWGVVLHNLIRPVKFSWQDTFKCVLFTVFVGIPLLLLAQKIPPFSLLYAAADLRNWGLVPQLLGFVLGVGVLEEVTKALPIYLFLLRPGKLSDPLTAAFYGTMSGLGFAVSEGVVYSVWYALGLVEGDIGLGSYVLTNTIRLVCLPLFHAIWAGIVGYFMGLAAINPSRQTAIIFIGVAIAAVLHGLYNTFAGSNSIGEGMLSLAVMAFSILLFVAYLRHSQKMVAQMQEAEKNSKL